MILLIYILKILFLRDVAQKIPDKSKFIIITSNTSADSLYNDIYLTLVKDGFGISQSNEKVRNLTTEIKYVGVDTYLKVNLFVEGKAEQSIARLSGQWQYGTSTQVFSQSLFGVSAPPTLKDVVWSIDYWEGGSKPNQAFAYMYKISKVISNNISFE